MPTHTPEEIHMKAFAGIAYALRIEVEVGVCLWALVRLVTL